ncbi:hypothetical protein MCOR27_005223 [Pyricularia oryzae]|uniref:Uncharacterized protein n=2 Tax=Pyricularia TaxID=48558 RepID=A0ABQ8NCW8_PYRGI|nr:hypothetical protein MCOR01_000778 [Pyricularia oryzae]KAI6295051.1 hypothetical protein MCOR33_007940 [Pyricularia grisea]KAH9428459.1 hypothetical protein MCOR02_011010 [Pyricularia oryzae]KAI6252377.1 hypothetical protein MCOR19_011007 [Pyricularia oryzae]KAI6276019.1 hypothetical protein MCOR26_005765 [Pyricularia oryzae]
MALARLITKSKDDDYSPVVSSPLNPESCYQSQMCQQYKPQRKITLAGRPTSKQRSPTQLLMRNKAALAFHHHAIAVSQSRGYHDLWADSGDIGFGRRRSSSRLVHLGSEGRTLRSPTKIAGRNTSRSTVTPSPPKQAIFPAPVGVSFDSIINSSGYDDDDDFETEEEDKVHLLTLQVNGDDFRVDFSGVTIDRMTTTTTTTTTMPMLMPRPRTIWDLWATPGRMLCGLVVVCCLLLLFFVKVQALFSSWFMR